MAPVMDEQQSLPPSYFANMGQPCCSCWGKSELEWIALAYVQALANDGDIWKRLSKQEVFRLLTDEQRTSPLHSIFASEGVMAREIYDRWFKTVADQIVDADGALGVGGFWRNS